MLSTSIDRSACANSLPRCRESLAGQAWRWAWCWLVAWGCLTGAFARAEDSLVQMHFKGGGWATGTLVPSDKPGYLRLQCRTFEEPLEFAIEALDSIETQEGEVRQSAAEHLVYVANGTTLVGTLIELDEETAVIDSACLGTVRLPRAVLHHFIGNGGLGKLIYAGPRRADEWAGTAKGTDWKHEAGALVTSESGVTAVGDVNLPEKSEVRIALAWSRTPDFTLSLGCIRPAALDRIAAAASLEVWDGRLVMVREADEKADIVVLPDRLTERRRLELTIFLDQVSGLVAVCTPNGRLLGKLHVQDETPVAKQLIALSKHSEPGTDSELRLERCEVRQWNGELRQEWPDSDGAVLLDNGQVLNGKLEALDADRKEIAFVGEEGKQSQIPLKTIRQARFSSAAQEAVLPTSVQVLLADGSYLMGAWKQIDSGKVVFALDGVDEPVRFSLSDLIGVTGNSDEFKPPKLTGRSGELTTETAMLTGCLEDSEHDGVLRWRARATSAPASLAAKGSGRIDYDRSRAEAAASTPPAMKINVLGLGGAIVLRNGRVASPHAAPPTRKQLAIGLKLRQGDELQAIVKRIDERGVTFESSETSVTFLPNEVMESVALVSSRAAGTQSPEKLKRLMTVPRSSKNDPPTHLIVSTDGDYLRGRLIELDKTRVVMEVRLEEIELPADRVAEVHWLHSRDWQESKSDDKNEETGNAAESSKENMLHVLAIRQNGRPATFIPTAVANETLYGKSELLGECNIELANLRALHFGANLSESVEKMKEERWKLSLATLPKVYQESEGGPGENSSPLVGKPAPDFTLNTASGERFELSKQRGRVLVLDFWASWCGPCLQTMPEVERVVHDIGGDQVDLVAVNLQETKERALATVKRLGLSPTIVLDEDGSVAQQYQATAIPQTVIIDRQGKLTHLFIGGGQRFISEFTEALSSVVSEQ